MIFHITRFIMVLSGPFIGYLFFGKSMNAALVGLGISSLVVVAELVFEKIPLDSLAFGGIGAVSGLILAKVVDWVVFKLGNDSATRFTTQYFGLISLFLGYLGATVAIRKKDELDLLDKNIVVADKKGKDTKVLDTSVLIDGRLFDVIHTGFLSGKILVPRFVLEELQHVADSQDATKRQRGRRGLDILKKIQDLPDVNVKVYDKDYASIKEVDSKLVELAKEVGGKVVTVDFNLNKVAALQGVSVLNVNDLAGALKAVVIPGDILPVFLIKEGKERFQAVGYMEDGTMVVVDDGRPHMGKRVKTTVSSILQTSAGRMIFTKFSEVLAEVPVDHKQTSTADSQQNHH